MSSLLDTVGGTTFITGFQGQITGQRELAVIETRINENATAIDFGGPVVRGVAVVPGGPPGNCKPAATGTKFIGIAARLLSEANTTDSTGVVNYPRYHEVPVLKRGWIWVKAVEAVTEGDDIIAVVASQSGLGGTTGGAADTTTRLALQGGSGQWQQTVGSGAVGLVSISCV